jgi:hypothetical protein
VGDERSDEVERGLVKQAIPLSEFERRSFVIAQIFLLEEHPFFCYVLEKQVLMTLAYPLIFQLPDKRLEGAGEGRGLLPSSFEALIDFPLSNRRCWNDFSKT